jgi:hypothetical protein
MASIRAALDEQKSAAATRVAALEATIAEKGAELAGAKKPAERAADAPAATGRVITTANVVPGKRVRRGPRWMWDCQDGGAERLGTLSETRHGSEGWC